MLKRFGDLVEGDIIRGVDGKHVVVRKGYDEHIPEKMYEITNDEGEVIKASGNHLWYIETKYDYQLHRSRRVEGKKVVEMLDPESIELLVNIATNDEDEIETTLADMIALFEDNEKDSRVQNSMRRIAESIGHIAENNTSLEDLHTGEKIESIESRTYDAKIFSQQILSLLGRKMKKRWPLIVGRVVTTEQLVDLYKIAEIPVAKMR